MALGSSVYSVLNNQKNTLRYGFMAFGTLGGQKATLQSFYQCPCNVKQNMAYGLSFLLGPALVLFIISIVLSKHLWRLYTGCCLNPRKLCPQGKKYMGCLSVLLKVIVEALVAPIMWLSFALLHGAFYVCAVSGVEEEVLVDWFCKNMTNTCKYELAKVPCNTPNLLPVDNKELLLMLHAQSQILGWVLIVIYALAALIGTCYKNCHSEVSYLQLTFQNLYKKNEKMMFQSYAKNYATKLADRNLKSFFENKDPEAFPFPNHTAWEQISALYTYNHGEHYYSTLQRYVEAPNRDYTPEKIPVEMEHNLWV
ncbi:calcium homeostasis modulator protein 5-like [Neoarius graeffei]|uniref:calcium homeostasis modulator protein 5-like n=1 Tax=Neoarius graeffei TaxID=443677 RepID=UPI00298C6FD4|nr:calcium homeostasis modulator protein 5-like [Neoarius graeffei]